MSGSGNTTGNCVADLADAQDDDIGRTHVQAVWPSVKPFVRRTPVIRLDCQELGLPSGPLVVKLEQLQHSGSFKARGAFANLLLHPPPGTGVVAASGGNHGAAVAYAARSLGVEATIFVPEVSSPAKVARISSYGARVVVSGRSYDEARSASELWRARSGAMDVPAYDSVATILGAGSLGLEVLEQAPEVTTVLAPVGGGGLLAGVCAAYEGSVEVVGAEPTGAPTLARALEAGKPVDAPVGSIAIDSLAPRQVGKHTFALISRLGNGSLLVEDEDIREAQSVLWDRLRLVAEPGGCAAFAAICSGRYLRRPGEVVAVVLSGANTTAVDFGN
ncbi:MAG: threonine/serine dehydratase [Acidimicrobiales bacterium]